MSNNVQNKMLEFEVTPPPSAWSNIANALDDAALTSSLSHKLQTAIAVPPASVWHAISSALTVDELTPLLASKLKNAEAVPPVAAWSFIAASLNKTKETIISQKRVLSPLLKYAAAAAVAGLMVFGGYSLLKNKNNDNPTDTIVKINTGTSITDEKATVADGNPDTLSESSEIAATDNAIIIAEEKRNDAALEASKHTFAKLEPPAVNKIKRIAAAYQFSSALEDNAAGLNNLKSGIAPTHAENNNRYITVMTPDCNLIRISKKLKHLTCCITGEVVDKSCQLKLEKWRKQMASAAAHPANFIDIMELVDALGDDQ